MNNVKFMAYDSVREDGQTNMFDIAEVIRLAKKIYNVELTKEDVLDIIQNYGKYQKKYYTNND